MGDLASMIEELVERAIFQLLRREGWGKDYWKMAYIERLWSAKPKFRRLSTLSLLIREGYIEFLRERLRGKCGLTDEDFNLLKSLPKEYLANISSALSCRYVSECYVKDRKVYCIIDPFTKKSVYEEGFTKLFLKMSASTIFRSKPAYVFRCGVWANGERILPTLCLIQCEEEELAKRVCNALNKLLQLKHIPGDADHDLTLILLSGDVDVKRIVGIDMLGERVRCPYCGDYGVIKVKKVKSKGKSYEYLAIYHRGGRYCFIRRLSKYEEGVGNPGSYVDVKAFLIPKKKRVRFFTSGDSFSEFVRGGRRIRRREILTSDFRCLKLKGSPNIDFNNGKIFECRGKQGAKLSLKVSSNDVWPLSDCRYLVKRFNSFLTNLPYFSHGKPEDIVAIQKLFKHGNFILKVRGRIDFEDGSSEFVGWKALCFILNEFSRFLDLNKLSSKSAKVEERYNFYFTLISDDASRFFCKSIQMRLTKGLGELIFEEILRSCYTDLLIRFWKVPMPQKNIYQFNLIFMCSKDNYEKVKFIVDFMNREERLFSNLRLILSRDLDDRELDERFRKFVSHLLRFGNKEKALHRSLQG